MKKLAILAVLAAAATAASAQSSVTLFGVVDIGVRSAKNGDNSVKSMSTGGINTSRLGFRGVEDLGDGLLAGFWLESGISPDTGVTGDSAGRFFNRRSTLSLNGGFGELRLGRDFTPSYTGYSDFDVFGDNGVAAGSKFFLFQGNDKSLSSKTWTNVDTNTRGDNQVQYFLPSGMGGVYGSLSVAPGEGTAGKKYTGGRIGYAAGPLNLSAAYGQTTVTPLSGFSEDKYKVMVFGAAYDLGIVKLQGYYSETKYAVQKLDTFDLGASVPLGLGVLKVGYTDVNAKGGSTDANDARQFALGYVYNLSKRTAVYGTAAYIDNKGAAAYVVDTNPLISAAGKKSTGYEVGVRHSF